MDDYDFELGWGFYLIILPLIINITIEAVIRPLFLRLDEWIFKMKYANKKQKLTLKKLLQWLKK